MIVSLTLHVLPYCLILTSFVSCSPRWTRVQVEDVEGFSARVHRAMAKTMNLGTMDLLPEADIPEEVNNTCTRLQESRG